MIRLKVQAERNKRNTKSRHSKRNRYHKRNHVLAVVHRISRTLGIKLRNGKRRKRIVLGDKHNNLNLTALRSVGKTYKSRTESEHLTGLVIVPTIVVHNLIIEHNSGGTVHHINTQSYIIGNVGGQFAPKRNPVTLLSHRKLKLSQINGLVDIFINLYIPSVDKLPVVLIIAALNRSRITCRKKCHCEYKKKHMKNPASPFFHHGTPCLFKGHITTN